MTAADWTPEKRAELRCKYTKESMFGTLLDALEETELERDKAQQSEAGYRELFEENNKQRHKIILENFELKRRMEQVANRLDTLKDEYDPQWRIAVYALAALARDNQAPGAGEVPHER